MSDVDDDENFAESECMLVKNKTVLTVTLSGKYSPKLKL
jgi:hypothetical protein